MTNAEISLAKTHYENFPVIGGFIPKHLRQALAAVYHFARTADDIADEGDHSPEWRLQQLDALDKKLPESIHQAIKQHQLQESLFHDLLVAFKQDVIKKSFETYQERLDYCRYSANPIGRLVLGLFKQDSAQACLYADQLCTALQILNFLQDIHNDWLTRQRLYIPNEALKNVSLTQAELIQLIDQPTLAKDSARLAALITNELQYCDELIQSSRGLLKQTQGRCYWQIRLIFACAYIVLANLKKRGNAIDQTARLGFTALPKLIGKFLVL